MSSIVLILQICYNVSWRRSSSLSRLFMELIQLFTNPTTVSSACNLSLTLSTCSMISSFSVSKPKFFSTDSGSSWNSSCDSFSAAIRSRAYSLPLMPLLVLHVRNYLFRNYWWIFQTYICAPDLIEEGFQLQKIISLAYNWNSCFQIGRSTNLLILFPHGMF